MYLIVFVVPAMMPCVVREAFDVWSRWCRCAIKICQRQDRSFRPVRTELVKDYDSRSTSVNTRAIVGGLRALAAAWSSFGFNCRKYKFLLLNSEYSTNYSHIARQLDRLESNHPIICSLSTSVEIFAIILFHRFELPIRRHARCVYNIHISILLPHRLWELLSGLSLSM